MGMFPWNLKSEASGFCVGVLGFRVCVLMGSCGAVVQNLSWRVFGSSFLRGHTKSHTRLHVLEQTSVLLVLKREWGLGSLQKSYIYFCHSPYIQSRSVLKDWHSAGACVGAQPLFCWCLRESGSGLSQ